MKIINRNTNYNSRLMRSLCLFAAGIFGAGGIIAAASVLTSRQSSYAANLTVVNDDFSSIGAAEVQFRPDEILMSNLIDNIPVDIHTFIPYENGKDFIIESLGSFTLKKYNCTQEDAKGRLLSKLSPLFFDILHLA